MSEFLAYPHVEKHGHLEVDGIDIGRVHIFPKLDGTNASLWIDGELQAGSRTRQLTDAVDNAGFRTWAIAAVASTGCHDFLRENPHYILYGEWLVPHSFKGYREEAWRRFWVFDVYNRVAESFVCWEDYRALLEPYEIDLIYPLAIVNNPNEKQLLGLLESNSFLCEDGAGPGEGIVLKQYGYRNRFGRVTWAKMVRNEFKERHKVAMGVDESDGGVTVEMKIAEKFVIEAFVAKERAKIESALCNEMASDTWSVDDAREYLCSQEARKQLIPRLLQTCFYELVREHAWDMVKIAKRPPTVDFVKLNQHTILRVKAFAGDLF